MGPYRDRWQPAPKSWWERNYIFARVTVTATCIVVALTCITYAIVVGSARSSRTKRAYKRCIHAKKLYSKLAECKLHNVEHAHLCFNTVGQAYCSDYARQAPQ